MPSTPITGNTDRLAVGFADYPTMHALHMVTADPARTPSFTMFGDPNYFFQTAPKENTCDSPVNCVFENPAFAWNHGDLQRDILTTWLGMVGPGIRPTGVTKRVWSDHTDIRPTLIALAGLQDDYVQDGRLSAEFLTPSALPPAFRNNTSQLIELASVYKQLNAPLGRFGMAAVRGTTDVIADGNAFRYDTYASQLDLITQRRDAVASEIRQVLQDVEFNDRPVSDNRIERLIGRAMALLRAHPRADQDASIR